MESLTNKLRYVWLCSAAVVTLARVFNAAELGELPIQIQAGQHLIAGKSLTVYSSPGEDDLAQPARLVRLAHYPAGYSLYTAALLGLGISVATLVKLFFALTTLSGWWGWGRLAGYFFADGLRRGRGWTAAAFIIAGCTPLVYTMLWKGTDTFLWAAAPWVLLWITTASRRENARGRWLDFIAGWLCGLSFLMRYAALFLVIYAAAIVLCQSGGHPKRLLSRLGAFAAGSLPFLITQFYFNQSPNAEPIPDLFTLDGGIHSILNRLGKGFPYLTSANISAVWWMPHQLIALVTAKATWLLILTCTGWVLLPLVVIGKLGCRSLPDAARDVRIVATGFLVMLPIFLFAWTGVADYIYVLESRYYLVALPIAVLIFYQLAIPVQPNGSQLAIWLSRASLVYLAGYICVAVISVARLVVPGEIGDASRVKLMALPKDRWHWLSNKTTYEFSPGRAYIINLLKADPATVLVTNHEEWFYAEPGIDRSRIRRPKDLRATYVSGPARIIIAIQDHEPGPLTRVAWFGHYDQRWIADYFDEITDIRLLKTFPDEQIRVVEARVKADERIRLTKESARIANF